MPMHRRKDTLRPHTSLTMIPTTKVTVAFAVAVVVVVTVATLSSSPVDAFTEPAMPSLHVHFGCRRPIETMARRVGPLAVASREVATDEVKASTRATPTTAIPYVVSRGDGSTGGGGLPMPHSSSASLEDGTDDDGLRRPKVAAEMPKG